MFVFCWVGLHFRLLQRKTVDIKKNTKTEWKVCADCGKEFK